MTDTLTNEQRKRCMSGNHGKDTLPELVVRRTVHSLGYRFRLHRKDLPGCPDLVFPARRKILFINGCYWHRHKCKKGQSLPETRKVFWKNKFDGTIKRDKYNRKKLKMLGWKTMTIWECEITNIKKMETKLIKYLGK